MALDLKDLTAAQTTSLGALAIFFVALTLGLSFYDEELAHWGDNAQFIVLAKSLVAGSGMREINHPESPPHHKYPLGFPLQLALLEWLFPDSLQLMKSFVLLQFALSAVLLFLLLSGWRGNRLAWIVTLSYCANRLSLQFSHQVMSEVPYVLFSLLALLLYEKQQQASTPRRQGLLLLSLLAALGAALTIRTVGLALFASIGLAYLLQRQWGKALAVAGALALLSGLNLRYHPTGAKDSYLTQLLLNDWYHPERGAIGIKGLILRMGENLRHYLSNLLPESILPVEGRSLLLAATITLLVLIGLCRAALRQRVATLYFFAFFLILLCWPPYWGVHRMIFPLVPLTLFFFVEGLLLVVQPLLSRTREVTALRLRRYGAVIVVLLLCLSNIVEAVQHDPRNDKNWQHYYQALRWLRQNSPSDSVILCRKPHQGYLLSGRKTLWIYDKAAKMSVLQFLQHYRVRYLIVDRLGLGGRDETLSLLKAHPHLFSLIFATPAPRTYIFQYTQP
jgi:hypothetical protein